MWRLPDELRIVEELPWAEIQLAAHFAVAREERNLPGIDFIAQRGFTELEVREKILQTSRMILCDMVSKEASTKQLLLRPVLGWNCFSVHPYKSCSAPVCWRSLQKAVFLAIPNSIYPIQIAANPCLSFGTVLSVRPEQSQGNNVKLLEISVLTGFVRPV